MKVTIKTLQQKVFQVCYTSYVISCTDYQAHLLPCSLKIDAEGADTVGDLKNKISESQGHPVDNQKLIYSGELSLRLGFVC